MKIRYLFFLLVWSITTQATAQMVGKDLRLEDHFAFEVKTIDEFLERFNDDPTTVVKTYALEKFNKKLSREELVKSLFNFSEPLWKKDDATEFVSKVCSAEKPVFLDFYSEDWYALCECAVLHKGKPKKIVITLNVLSDKSSGSAKWVIRGAFAPFLDLPKRGEPGKFLNPISHATDFIGLKKALDDKQHMKDYIHEDFNENRLSMFLTELNSGTIQFVQIDKITYHFLNVPDWIFTVNHFKREGRNSGWLINKVSKKSNYEKEEYRKKVLFLD